MRRLVPDQAHFKSDFLTPGCSTTASATAACRLRCETAGQKRGIMVGCSRQRSTACTTWGRHSSRRMRVMVAHVKTAVMGRNQEPAAGSPGWQLSLTMHLQRVCSARAVHRWSAVSGAWAVSACSCAGSPVSTRQSTMTAATSMSACSRPDRASELSATQTTAAHQSLPAVLSKPWA